MNFDRLNIRYIEQGLNNHIETIRNRERDFLTNYYQLTSIHDKHKVNFLYEVSVDLFSIENQFKITTNEDVVDKLVSEITKASKKICDVICDNKNDLRPIGNMGYRFDLFNGIEDLKIRPDGVVKVYYNYSFYIRPSKMYYFFSLFGLGEEYIYDFIFQDALNKVNERIDKNIKRVNDYFDRKLFNFRNKLINI
jgi:hypothetical protein